MSKMYQRYQELKRKNPEKIYLFKSGIFYLFLADDAKKMSAVLSLKLTNLNETVLKCGFPVNNLNKYLTLLKDLGYEISIVDSVVSEPLPSKNYLLNANVKNLINKLALINTDELSIKEAYSLIDDFQAQANSIKEELEN